MKSKIYNNKSEGCQIFSFVKHLKLEILRETPCSPRFFGTSLCWNPVISHPIPKTVYTFFQTGMLKVFCIK